MTGKPLLISGAKGQSSGPVASFRAASKPLSITAQITPVQSGSGDPSPDNVRPISGWTGVNVSRTGVNVWDEEWENGYYNRSNGNKAGSSETTYFRSKNYIPCSPNTQYYFKAPTIHAENNTYYAVLFYDFNKQFISAKNNVATKPVQTTPSDARYMTFYVQVGTSGSTYQHDISINCPSADHDYHAFNGSTVTITFPQDPGTVYGGTLAIAENGSVTLSVDRKLITVGNSGWTYCSPYIYKAFSDKATPPERGTAEYPLICSMLPYDGVKYASQISDVCCAQATNQNIYIKDTSCTSENEYYAKYSGATVLYYLATPQTYTLTPITPITALAGENNVWADSGDTLVNYIKQGLFYIS